MRAFSLENNKKKKQKYKISSKKNQILSFSIEISKYYTPFFVFDYFMTKLRHCCASICMLNKWEESWEWNVNLRFSFWAAGIASPYFSQLSALHPLKSNKKIKLCVLPVLGLLTCFLKSALRAGKEFQEMHWPGIATGLVIQNCPLTSHLPSLPSVWRNPSSSLRSLTHYLK